MSAFDEAAAEHTRNAMPASASTAVAANFELLQLKVTGLVLSCFADQLRQLQCLCEAALHAILALAPVKIA